MKSLIFACLLVVAGVSAFPQDVDVVPSEGRIVDLFLIDLFERYIQWVKTNKMDPWTKEKYAFDDTIIDNRVHFKGFVEKFEMWGLSKLTINRCEYNILLGRIDLDISFDKLAMSIGKYKADIRYGNAGGTGVLSGAIELENIRLSGNALLYLYPGSPVTILNINTRFTIADVRANFTASWRCLGCWEATEYTSEINNLLNVLFPDFLTTFEGEIGTILGEVIRRFVNRYWLWN